MVGLSKWLGGLHERSHNWGKWRWLYVILLPWLALAAWGATFRRGRSVAYITSGVVGLLWLSVVAAAVSPPSPEQASNEAATLATPTTVRFAATILAPTATPSTSTSSTTTTITSRTRSKPSDTGSWQEAAWMAHSGGWQLPPDWSVSPGTFVNAGPSDLHHANRSAERNPVLRLAKYARLQVRQ